MIELYSEIDFEVPKRETVLNWLSRIISSEGKEMGDIGIVFCDDQELHRINVEFLNHDTFTDIITFDYSLGSQLHGEIYISVDRVKENAEKFGCSFLDELHRVMCHGVLHLIGYKDKTKKEADLMRKKENEFLETRNFI